MSENSRDSWFHRTAERIGDFGNPFYDDERRRDVWNEASAIGMQVMLWLGLIGATAALWIVGADAVPYSLTIFIGIGLSSWVVILYAASLGVTIESQYLARWRMVPYLLIIAAFAGGLIRVGLSQTEPGEWTSSPSLLLVAGGIGAAAAVVGMVIDIVGAKRRRC